MHFVIPVITDKHALHTLGLLNPDTEFQRKGKNNEFYPYNRPLSPDQEDLWQVHQEIIDTSVKMADGDPIILYDLGDQGQGMKYTDDLESLYLANHIVAPYWNLVPWMRIPNLRRAYLVAGTSSHDHGAGALTILITKMLSGEFQDKEIIPVYHGLTKVAPGVDIDYSHHGPGQSARSWLEGNTARYYLRDIMMSELMEGKTPPKIVLRGDKHSIIFEELSIWNKNRFVKSQFAMIPPLCKMGDFARQVTKSLSKIIYGGVIFEIIDGRMMEPVWITRTEDIRRKDELTWTEQKSTGVLSKLLKKSN